MALTQEQIDEIQEVGEAFLEKRRPPVEVRSEVDLGFKIEGQSVLIFEIRPQWNKPSVILQHPVAKTTYVKTQNHWKVFWMRADLKWHSYPPKPTVNTIKQFFTQVDGDVNGCFFG